MSRNVTGNDGRRSYIETVPQVIPAGAAFTELASQINALSGIGLVKNDQAEIIVRMVIKDTMPAGSQIVITPYKEGYGALPTTTLTLGAVTDSNLVATSSDIDNIRNADGIKVTYRFQQGVEYTVTALNIQVKKKSLISSALQAIPQVIGTIYYVDGTNGADSNNGLDPANAFATIGAAIVALSDGDAIIIEAGTYTETGLDVTNNSIQIQCNIGVLIDPASGTALTLSGNSIELKGMHKITPGAGEIGLLISGDECHVEHGTIIGGATCIQVTGTGVMINDYAAGFSTVAAFDLRADQASLYNCKTVGNAATYGYYINSGADTGVLQNCTSSGHETSGFYIDTLSQDWTVLKCSSGAGDGRWVDIDNANVWSDFTYADEVFKTTTFAGAATEYNIFKLTGGVRISELEAHVDTVIPNTACNVHLEVYSVGGSSDISLSPGVDIDSAVAGSVIVRNGPAASALDLGNPNGAPAFMENATFNKPETEFDVVEDDTNDTYIRVILSAALASGAIHWHCKWRPLTDNGVLKPV